MSKQVADGIRDNNGFWKHGHTYMVHSYPIFYVVSVECDLYDQAHPLSCVAAIAVQKVIAAENLLENGRQSGELLARLLRERLQSPSALAQPFVFDVRGGGSFWAVEFDLTGPEGRRLDLKGQALAMVVQARCLEMGLIVMGMTGGANIKGTEGDLIIFAPAYNITGKEVEKVVEMFVKSLEEVLRESV
jgi:E3 ubiquitin-protein ligase TRIP12